jgi:quinoprotein glucose dehydrogenase
MLADWSDPPGQDRVIGVWRPLLQRNENLARDAAFPVLEAIVRSAPEPVRVAAVELIEKIGAPDADLLLEIVKSPDMPPAVGAAALKAMAKGKDPRLDDAVEAALKNGKGVLRTAAVKELAKRPDAGERLNAILDAGAIPDQQAVLSTLGSLNGNGAAAKILDAWMDKLLAGAVAPEVRLDLLESAEESEDSSVRRKLRAFEKRRADAAAAAGKPDPLAEYRDALVGGDATLGRRIFLERADVSCLRCHKLNGQGGVAGPDLTGVAATKDRAYLLSSLVDPNRDIAPGFEAVTVHLKAGTRYTGVVRREDDAEMILDPGDGATVHVAKKELDKRTRGLSPMPQDVIKPLTKREVRDLVEFLASLKTPATQPATQAAAGAGQ